MLKEKQSATNYAKEELAKIKKNLKHNRFWFAVLNAIIIVGTAVISILTSLMISKLILKDIPDWFFITTTAIAASGILFSSFINFFGVNQKIKNCKNKILKIDSEIWKHRHKVTKYYKSNEADFHLFRAIEIIKENMSAEKEF